MDDRELAISMGRLRRVRVRERDESAGAGVDEVLASVRKLGAAESAASAAWEACVPDEYRGSCAFVSLKRGVLAVRASDAGVRYRVNRWLGSGGEAAVMRGAKVGVVRVRVVL